VVEKSEEKAKYLSIGRMKKSSQVPQHEIVEQSIEKGQWSTACPPTSEPGRASLRMKLLGRVKRRAGQVQ
jgi:hypothetical protein